MISLINRIGDERGLMVQVTSDEVGRALYHLLKSGKGAEQFHEEVLPYLDRRTEIRRIIRQFPDGSIEIQEHEITDERLT